MSLHPENKTAVLMSEGSWTMTPHTYVKTVPVVLPIPKDADVRGDGDAYEHVFRCDVTGVERRWGTVDPRWANTEPKVDR